MLRGLIESISNSPIDDDPEHQFAQVVALASSFYEEVGDDGVREMLTAGAQHFGFTKGVTFRKQIGFSPHIQAIGHILSELSIRHQDSK